MPTKKTKKEDTQEDTKEFAYFSPATPEKKHEVFTEKEHMSKVNKESKEEE